MSFLDKLKFWKKDDSKIEQELFGNDFKNDLNQNSQSDPFKNQNNNLGFDDDNLTGLPQGPPEPQPAFQQQREFQQQQPQQMRSNSNELVIAKLDAIKATLDTLNQRLNNLEKPNEKRRQW